MGPDGLEELAAGAGNNRYIVVKYEEISNFAFYP